MRRFGFAVVALGILGATQAAAYEFGVNAPDAPRDFQSPQHFALEIKFGTYSPHIDSTPNLTGMPFSELFNNQYDPTQVGKLPQRKLLSTIEFDYQIWHGFGSIGVGVSVGFQRRSTHAFEYLMSPGLYSCSVPACVRSADTTTINLIPITVEAIYRFDVLALRYRVPIVPYFKVGLGYDIFVFQAANGNVEQSLFPGTNGNPDKGYGGTAGFVMHPGAAILLDVLDATAARALDTELGINHTYVFAELNYANITGLGFKDKIVLSDTTWNAGFAFEF